MRKQTISAEEYKEIVAAEKATQDKQIARKLRTLMLRYEGKSNEEAGKQLGLCSVRISQLVNEYKKTGIENFTRKKYGGNHRSMTEEEEEEILNRFREQAEAGQPVLLVVGDYERFVADSEDEEPEEINITPLGSSFAKEPLTTGGVHGTYAYEWVDEGTVVVGGGKIGQAGNTLVLAEGKENTDCTRDISANTGYIVYRENILKDASVEEFDMVITTGRPVVKGDLNNDGNANFTDATSVLTVMGTGEYNAEADVNNDGVVNFTDYISILTIMAQQ